MTSDGVSETCTRTPLQTQGETVLSFGFSVSEPRVGAYEMVPPGPCFGTRDSKNGVVSGDRTPNPLLRDSRDGMSGEKDPTTPGVTQGTGVSWGGHQTLGGPSADVPLSYMCLHLNPPSERPPSWHRGTCVRTRRRRDSEPRGGDRPRMTAPWSGPVGVRKPAVSTEGSSPGTTSVFSSPGGPLEDGEKVTVLQKAKPQTSGLGRVHTPSSRVLDSGVSTREEHGRVRLLPDRVPRDRRTTLGL